MAGRILTSVLLPCCDAATYLPQAIRSLAAQTFRGFEVIAVDDGSRDGSGELLDRWAERDSRVRVLHLARVGLARALQEGSKLCEGELLARFDADDVAHPRRLAEQLDLLAARKDIAAVGTRVRYFPSHCVGWGGRRYERWINSLIDPEDVARDMFVECPIAHPTLVVRRTLFDDVGGYRVTAWPEDYDLILRLYQAGARLANVPRLLHFWRERPDRASRTEPRYSSQAFLQCKVAYLHARLPDRRSLAIWGAGRVGKALARALSSAGIRVESFYDIDPDKIGQSVYGIPVRDAALAAGGGGGGGHYLLVSVGSAGARQLIRSQLAARGLAEPGDYRCMA